MICVLCGNLITGYGHNPEPLKSFHDGRACDICQDVLILPARLRRLVAQLPPRQR